MAEDHPLRSECAGRLSSLEATANAKGENLAELTQLAHRLSEQLAEIDRLVAVATQTAEMAVDAAKTEAKNEAAVTRAAVLLVAQKAESEAERANRRLDSMGNWGKALTGMVAAEAVALIIALFKLLVGHVVKVGG